MRLWAGLGYYSRARNLHACAQAVADRFGGRFPAEEATLLTLPGIGAYTAAAISAIAFDRRAVVVDGNVERVVTRLHALDQPLPAAKPAIRRLADELTPDERPGDFAQAMMDLGATICTPRRPSCALCPFRGACAAQRAGTQEAYPRKTPKTVNATRYGAAFVAVRADGAVLVRTRPPKGLLGGMTEVPGTDWTPDENAALRRQRLLCQQPGGVGQHQPATPSRISRWRTVWRADVPAGTRAPDGMRWIAAGEIAGEAFPTLFRKVLAVGMA